MGYGGYLVKFGNYTIPNNLIKQGTFSSYLNMQDLDPWTVLPSMFVWLMPRNAFFGKFTM